MIKVVGSAEIQDSDWMVTLLGKWNEIGEAIAYTRLSSEEIKEARRQMEEVARQLKDRNKRAQIEHKTKQAQDPKKLAKEMGLTMDEKLVGALRVFVETFYQRRFEVTIIPSEGTGDVVFCAVVKRELLRVSPEFLRGLYGSFVESPWTMVGQVTCLPGTGAKDIREEQPLSESTPATEEHASMRDSFRNLVRAYWTLERLIRESKDRLEVVVAPLAIYREVSLPN